MEQDQRKSSVTFFSRTCSMVLSLPYIQSPVLYLVIVPINTPAVKSELQGLHS